ncbi:tryptophan ABC transporter substrate-binding protein [Lacticaseibacillus zhaodongensis]|uniref:tryptophan ABC transporter substrate-binding protein n=1 Tax=Lacticaseibacillus zhaodongensis TaxID=2668065 RepID=UPI0012D3394F|nr:tryptophan ABC transporter substrate-binding protein [Lacticaseibacillus zhaodongensis]
MKKMITFVVAIIVVIAIGFGISMGHSNKKSSDQKDQVRTVGILQLMSHPALDAIHKGIVAGLKDEGYTKGKNLKIDFQNAQADQSNLKSMSERFVNNNDDATVGIATPSAQALADATKKIPIVMGAITDPVAAKLVQSVKKPGGNITGVSDQAPIDAQLKLIRQIMPKAKTLGVIYTSSDESSQAQVKMVVDKAPKYGFTVKKYSISSTNDLNQVAGQMVTQVQAIFVPTDNTIASAMPTLSSVANGKKIPIFPTVDTMVKQGGLATVGLDQYQLGVETGKMVAKILKGDKPATMPVKFMDKGNLVINEKVAKELGIKIPASVQVKAEKSGEVFK